MELQELRDDDGNIISPALPEGKKNYLIDIDGTITDDCPNEEPERMVTAEPFLDARETINGWYDEGHIITYFSSRTDEHRVITEEWLKKHGFKYHYLLLNKPRGGRYAWIDNSHVQAITYKGIWSDLVRKTKEIEIFKES